MEQDSILTMRNIQKYLMGRNMTGRVTIPTDVNIIKETKEIMKLWKADAVRDCDGTNMPKEIEELDAKIYATYYTTRKDNEWARANPDEVQQMYIMTDFYIAEGEILKINLMKGLHPELLKVNDYDDIKRWWEVVDRTTGIAVDIKEWDYDKSTGEVIIKSEKFHEYSVSFLAYIIWDPVHMYNAITNDWQNFEKQITFDVRQPKTREYSMKRLRKFLEEHPKVDVIRFTTFFHQFTLIFDELARQKFVDWYGYSASVSPYILEKFEKQVGYKFRPEYIIDQGYMHNSYRLPSKEFLDFIEFQRKEVAALAKEMVDIIHEYGKEAMMFLGDHWIGTEPYLDEFKNIGLDAVVGSVGNGQTLRLISEIEGVKYSEGRLLPYFFPDTFYNGGDPLGEAKRNWISARRAMLRKTVDRIGYGGYLKLTLDFLEFIDYAGRICDEFRQLYENTKDCKAYSIKKVAILNAWGRMRSWGNHMVHHAIYYKQNYSYAGILEALSGAPFDVSFISFDDIKRDKNILKDIDVIFNIGDADNAQTGCVLLEDVSVQTAINEFISEGGGFIGVGEPSGHQYQGRFFRLATCLGVEKETGFTLNKGKYNTEVKKHFITEDCYYGIDFGEGKRDIYALENTEILAVEDDSVQLAINDFGRGRTVYISGLPYSLMNTRLLYRAILWAAHDEDNIYKWFSTNPNTELHAYVKNNKFCVVNNTYENQETLVYKGDGSFFELELAPDEIKWFLTEY